MGTFINFKKFAHFGNYVSKLHQYWKNPTKVMGNT